jgi:hypothetical protein
MDSIPEEIKQLQSRILELEKQKKEQETHEIAKKTSLQYNFDMLNDIIGNHKSTISNKLKRFEEGLPPMVRVEPRMKEEAYQSFYNNKHNKYGVYKEQKILIPLEAIYHSLQLINDRLNKLEKQSMSA